MAKVNFFKKLGGFIRRNSYAIVMSFCVLFALSMLTAVIVKRVSDSRNTAPVSTIVTTPEPVVEVDSEVVEPSVPVSADPIVFCLPVKNATLGMNFADESVLYSKTLDQWQTHMGVDYLAQAGSEVLCVYNGKVVDVSYDDLMGYTVTIKHTESLTSIYKSLASEVFVSVGDDVSAGQKIGTVSQSAKDEELEGPHLHFEVLVNGKNVDPMQFLPEGLK